MLSNRANKSPELQAKIAQMTLLLAPLVRLTSGDVHPAFPKMLVSYWLLTDSQLEELSHFYHQRTPCELTRHYPCPMGWRQGLTLEEKRRKMGKFIGLRGCETPMTLKTEEEIIAECKRAREAAEDEIFRRKAQWY